MWTKEVVDMILKGIQETLYMTLLSTLMGYVIGLPMGVLLAVSDKDGLKPNRVLYRILDVIANIVRSIPFLILLILLIPFTRMIVGKSYGSTATVVPLVIAAGPFIARMVESSLKEVDEGVIEAARSMGASNLRIIVKVLLVEARTSLINGATIAVGTILGYSAMAGTIGGGGLGDIAIRYGYHRYQADIMIVTSALWILSFSPTETTSVTGMTTVTATKSTSISRAQATTSSAMWMPPSPTGYRSAITTSARAVSIWMAISSTNPALVRPRFSTTCSRLPKSSISVVLPR